MDDIELIIAKPFSNSDEISKFITTSIVLGLTTDYPDFLIRTLSFCLLNFY